MPLIDYPDLDDIDKSTAELLDQSRNDRGQIPSFPHLLAKHPALLGPALGQFSEVMYGGDLEPDLKQLAFVAVSQENECAYCAASHGGELVNAFGLEMTQLEALARNDYSQLTPRQRAVAEFAHEGATDPKRITDEHIEALREVGFDDRDVIELLAVVAQAAFANTIVDAMNILPSDQSPDLNQYYPRETPTESVDATDRS